MAEMTLSIPIRHDFSSMLQNTTSEDGFYFRTWEIRVPREDSMLWSIILSYLISTNLSKEEDFQRRLKLLTDSNENIGEIKKSISTFNPFRNRYSCFYDKNLQKAVSAFKKKLNAEVSNRCSTTRISVYDELEAASSILRCSIFLLNLCSGIKDVEIFPKKCGIPEPHSKITLFVVPPESKQDIRFSFGLKKELGLQMKNAAFTNILKQAKFTKKRRKELSEFASDKDCFIISLLKSEFRYAIVDLYKSSYLVGKLAEAGYETDPRTVDSEGFSALHHALATGDQTLLYLLYNYAANACHETDKSFRDPDQSVTDNLEQLGKILESPNQFVEKSDKISIAFNELKQFNTFLTKMSGEILRTRKEIQNDTSIPDALLDSIKRRDNMLVILDTYEEFYFLSNEMTQNGILCLDDYIKYSTYYENLDYSAALFFFDNIFYLKQSLPLESGSYSNIEASFFLSVLCNKYFPSRIHKLNYFYSKNSSYVKNTFSAHQFSKLNENLQINTLYIIPFLERFYLRDEIRKFSQLLRSVDIENNAVSTPPPDEVLQILASLPEIRDELLMCKLICYFEAVKNAKPENIKSVLVIERALQVIGESLVFGRDHPRSLSHLLPASLPDTAESTLKQIRNILSHTEEHDFEPKFKAEKNSHLFRSVQTEVGKIREVFEGIFNIQQFRVIEFILERTIRTLKSISRDSLLPNRSYKPFMSEYQIKEALSGVNREYQRVRNLKIQLCYNNPVFKNNVLFKNLLVSAETQLRDETLWVNGIQFVKEKAMDILWPLEYLLTFLAEDCKEMNSENMSEDRRKLIESKLQILNSTEVTEIKQKLKEYVSTYKDFYSNLYALLHNNIPGKESEITTSINEFKKMLKGFTFLNEKEKQEIRSYIPQDVKDTIEFKNKLQELLENGLELTQEQILKFPTLFLSKKKLEKLKKVYSVDRSKALEIIKTADNPVNDLNDILKKSNLPKKKDFILLCERMKFPEEIKAKLSKFDIGNKTITPRNKILNLLDRVDKLRCILVEERSEIRDIWSKAKNSKTKTYVRYKIVQRYLRDTELQASVEMLLFDCMNILRNKWCLGKLWIKTPNLFSGISLRNVLGHGNPTLEIVGKLLDPEDFPSMLIKGVLQLIEDEDAIQAIYELCSLTKLDFNHFQDIMDNNNDTEYYEIKRRILRCDRWVNYSMIIPRPFTKFPISRDTSSNISYTDEE